MRLSAAPDLDVSVVIPCLDEAASIGICVEKALAALARLGLSGEVVVADNGSTDDSALIAVAKGARVVPAGVRGYGAALRAGIDASHGRFIVMGDADDSYDFGDLDRFVDAWRAGYDVVLGDRFAGGIRRGAMPWHHRYIGNPVLTRVLSTLFRTPVHDAHCGMRGFTRDAYDRMDLRTTGMEFASEMIAKAAGLGLRMTEVPVPLWPDRRGRPPHLRSAADGWRHLRFMLLYSPGWLFLVPGTAMFVVGMAIMLWLLPGERQVGSVAFDVHSMVGAMILCLIGVQVVSMGLFAKVYSHAVGFSNHDGPLERRLRELTLERSLIVGGVVAAAGLAGDATVLARWAAGGFGELDELRAVILSSTWLFIGVQLVFGAFLLSMLGNARDTFIGDP